MTETKEETTTEQELLQKEEDDSKSLKQEMTELTETLQRLQAEFENFKKRAEKEKAACMQFAKHSFVIELLPIIDNFERALETTENEGITLIWQQLQDLLAQNDIKTMDALGKKFDPLYHEALIQEESEQEAGTVTKVLQKGYIGHDTIVRTAQVAISKGKRGDKKEVSNETHCISKGGSGDRTAKHCECEHQ